MVLNKEKIFLIVKLLFPILLLLLVVFELRKMFLNLNVDLLVQYIQDLGFFEVILIVIGGFLAVTPMIFYDFYLAMLLRIDIPKKEIIEYSIITNTFSNLLGFGGLIGGALRTYFYGPYERDRRKLLVNIGVISLFGITGISLMAWFIITGLFSSSILTEHKWLHAAIWLVGLYLPFYLINLKKSGKKRFETPIQFQHVIKLLLASVFEWFFIFLVLWGLCYILKIPVTLKELFPVFIIASCTGIISMIPGGLGTFDLVFLWGLQDLINTDEKVIILLLLYRLGYFIIPFFIGLFVLLKLYWGKWNKSWSNIPSTLVQNVSHMVLTGLVFLSGIILLLSAAVPGILERLKNIEEIFSLPIINLSHQLSVATGFVLLALSRGIEYKSRSAYFLTLSVLILAAIFTFIKGFDYEEAIFIILVAVLLRMSKKRFYRENFVLTWGKILFDLFIIVLFTTLYIVIGIINLPMTKINLPPSLIPYVIVDSNDLFISAIVGLSIAVFIMGLGYIVKGRKRFPLEYSETQAALIKNHIETFKGNTLTHLFLLGDKYFYWNKEEDVLFAYQIVADKLVILGDPVGNSDNIPHSIEELIETADIFGYTPVFYQVNSSMLPLLHGNGFDFFKLGEEAFVNLNTFSLAGKKGKNFRAIKNRFAKGEFNFLIIDPPFSEELLKDLQNVSDEWLCNRKEKGFSLGFFNQDYLEKAPIALLYNKEGNLVGFASLMPNYDGHETISVDLMRFIPNSPNGLMDYLFVSLFEWAKEAGYARFNMGMAPLSNVGSSRFSFLSEKIAAQIFLHGHFIYHFQGLRKFKEKYSGYWEPKYLAYRKNAGLPITMLQVTKLIAKRKQVNKV